MGIFSRRTTAPPQSDGAPVDKSKEVAESLYRQNLELAVTNKTLSLLEKLYGISILSLESKEIAKRISETIREDFNFAEVSILSFDPGTDTLTELASAMSPKFESVRGELADCFPKASETRFFSAAITEHKMGYTEELRDVFGSKPDDQLLAKLLDEGHARSAISFPLITEDAVIGVCLLILNRVYTELAAYEKDSMASFTNVIAVALDKARLYEQLKASNEQLGRTNERLRILDQQKTEFVSIASHQLRAPVTALKGYASLILEGSFGAVPETMKEAVSRIFESSKYMAASIDDFLSITRIEQGQMKYDYKVFDAVKLGKQTYEEYIPLAEKKKLELTFTGEGELNVNADENKIKQVMTNLVDNAVKYTIQGFVAISVSVDPSGTKVLFAVKDSGIGISEEDRQKLFTKFGRASNANTANVQGTGLGLFVAEQMVKAQGGAITIYSEGAGKGTTFTMELPGAKK